MGQIFAAFTWCIYQKNPWIWTVQSSLLIPEQILLLDITLIKSDDVSYITYGGFDPIGWKCMANKLQILSNVYFGAWYLRRFIYLENVIMLFDVVIWLFDSLRSNFLKTVKASLYYRCFLALALLVNFDFYQQYFQLGCS